MEPTTDQVVEQIKELTGHLEEVRSQIKAMPRTDALTAEVEDRITKKLAASFVNLQQLTDAEEKRKAVNEDTLKIIDELRSEIKRGAISAGKSGEGVEQEQRAALRGFLRSGGDVSLLRADSYKDYLGTLPEELRSVVTEKRSLTESTATEGGFLVPPIIDEEIIKNVVNISPFRTVARVIPITGPEYTTFSRTSRPTASWGSELTDPSATQSAYNQLRIEVHDMIAKTPVSQNLLMDAARIEQEMSTDAAEEFGRAEGAAFISGDGVKQPEGIVTNAKLTTGGIPVLTGNDAGNDLIAADDYYDLLYGTGASGTGLQEFYRANAVFLLNSNVLNKTLKLKDGVNNYLWNFNAGLQAGVPALIAGKPFRVMEDMDSDGTNANYPLACGDWSQCYRIVDRIGTQVLRDPFSSYPLVNFKWLRRVGGRVVKIEAARFIQV